MGNLPPIPQPEVLGRNGTYLAFRKIHTHVAEFRRFLRANAKQRIRSVVPGAVVCMMLWAISSVGFSIYLANFADYGVTYGSIGAAVGLLFYFYLCASVVLLGAELNAAIYHPPTGR
jgi:YihY family inner membrane protein